MNVFYLDRYWAVDNQMTNSMAYGTPRIYLELNILNISSSQLIFGMIKDLTLLCANADSFLTFDHYTGEQNFF